MITSHLRALAAAFGILLLAGASHSHEFTGPHGTVVLDWQAENVSRVIATGYGDSFGVDAWTRRGFPETVEVEGRQCLYGTAFLFDVDDYFAFDIDEDVTIDLVFDRTRTAGFMVGWDQNVVAENRTDIPFTEPGTGLFEHSITLERARFANRGESGTDLLVAAPNATFAGAPDENHRIVLCDVSITRSYTTPEPAGRGSLELSVTDGDESTPARIGLYDGRERMPLPGDDALTIHNYSDRTKQIFLRETFATIQPWPHRNRHIFYIDGDYTADLPAGSYDLVVTKGPEFQRVVRSVEIADGETTSVEIALERWTDMAATGWYSGDDHVHMDRDPEHNQPISALMKAEDLNVTNLLQMGNPYDTHFTQYAFGEDGRFRSGNHALVPGVEDPRTAVRGHTISMNIREVFRPYDRYLRYDRIFAEYRRQGGLSGYAHVAGRLFNVERGLAIDVPLGAVDFVELLQDGVLEAELWYDFLNLGFKLIPMAGSDFPYYNPPGVERNYAYVGETFSIDGYYDALRRQQTFVTNGPMLELSVDGAPMGSDLVVSPGDEIAIIADASLNPDIEALDRFELVVQGDVVATADAVDSSNALMIRHVLEVNDGIWLAVRAYGVDQAVAHSAPVYVTTVGGFEKASAVPAIARRMLDKLTEFETLEADEKLELEAWSVREPLTEMVAEQRELILERASEARAVYLRMLDSY